MCTYVCADCERSFETSTQLQSHLFRIHGERHLSRYYIDADNVCYACLKQFGARDSVVQHFRASPSCLANVVQHMAPLSRDEASNLDQLARSDSARRSIDKRPIKRMVRLCGPLFSSSG